ncbi:hypothetical protein, partial [Alicyclobacillus cellulosilyticus]
NSSALQELREQTLVALLGKVQENKTKLDQTEGLVTAARDELKAIEEELRQQSGEGRARILAEIQEQIGQKLATLEKITEAVTIAKRTLSPLPDRDIHGEKEALLRLAEQRKDALREADEQLADF